MRAVSKLSIVAAVTACAAYGQPTQTTASAPLASPTIVPAPKPLEATGTGQARVSAERPPAIPDLVPLNAEYQAAMANSQLETYRYNQLTEQALALKKLCETGFGPTDICPIGRSSASRPADLLSGNQSELPGVSGIKGTQNALSAELVLGDGRHITVRAGSSLPNGLTVENVTIDDVRLRLADGREATLYFGGSPQAK